MESAAANHNRKKRHEPESRSPGVLLEVKVFPARQLQVYEQRISNRDNKEGGLTSTVEYGQSVGVWLILCPCIVRPRCHDEWQRAPQIQHIYAYQIKSK